MNKFLLLFLVFFISRSEFLPAHNLNNLKDLLKDFGKGSESYFEKIAAQVKQQVLKEILKFSLSDFLNNTRESSNVTHSGFQNVMPLINFFKKMNLTNHTLDELEILVTNSIPAEYNTSNFHKLKLNHTNWNDFAEKFLIALLQKFSSNKTSVEFIDHIYQKLKVFHQASNHTTLTDTLETLGAITHEVLSNKETVKDIAKNIHNSLKDNTKPNIKSPVHNEAEVSNSFLIGMVITFIIALLALSALLIRRQIRKKRSEAYSRMEATSSLTATT